MPELCDARGHPRCLFGLLEMSPDDLQPATLRAALQPATCVTDLCLLLVIQRGRIGCGVKGASCVENERIHCRNSTRDPIQGLKPDYNSEGQDAPTYGKGRCGGGAPPLPLTVGAPEAAASARFVVLR